MPDDRFDPFIGHDEFRPLHDFGEVGRNAVQPAAAVRTSAARYGWPARRRHPNDGLASIGFRFVRTELGFLDPNATFYERWFFLVFRK
jgi:hypothetical protein